jgi:hypothetical protein
MLLFRAPQCVELLDQAVEIQRVESPLAQQLSLNLGPDVEILLIQVFQVGLTRVAMEPLPADAISNS